ncbi:Anti-sigma-K factor RskA [Variovorax sp. YR266]|uniref:anti-sigma factor n=1 Tax=Variovorax sp. YR266 TaxID=1884386 RepID=UPI00089AF928|nr:anti-sigma factor [Variovorax sp. YR266]SDZ38858.1 Anti-sigma-K factor RskA [Variovorax sp. YR266]
MRYTDARLLDALASAYALGTLEGGARRRFERLMRDRADVRDVVAQWEQRLGQLALSVPQRKPSADLWRAIAARTQPAQAQQARQARPSRWTSWLRPAGFSFGGLVAGVVAASALFLAVPGTFITSDQLAMRTGERLPQSYVGVLTDTEGRGRLLVSSLRHGRTVTLKVLGATALPVSGGERLVLWALPADAAPFAIGAVPASGAGTLTLPDTSEKLLSKVSRLVVTRERSASPAAPSADVVLSGACAKLW